MTILRIKINAFILDVEIKDKEVLLTLFEASEQN